MLHVVQILRQPAVDFTLYLGKALLPVARLPLVWNVVFENLRGMELVKVADNARKSPVQPVERTISKEFSFTMFVSHCCLLR
jgi:hypothetical protein